ncbi:hypothetical protein [Flavobacterium cyclinae]|uniref:hypothetical protein n=1 Tax=Flavobacterium cyclinae TaxID=2895947 RepID=UPI001E6459D9|nr:hypothetical protein [Flavobacterium cyclinae]UGS21478.1 hypothetical protein LOS86_02305 [Flavobacterium cyclinae]
MKKIVFSLIIVSTFISCKENTNETVKTEDTVIVETPVVQDTIITESNTATIDSAVAKSQETAKVKFQRIDEVAK